jgi:hypothetical protein
MTKALEALIVKGRTSRSAREQKESAFGLAEISTHKEMHGRICSKGGIKTLLTLMESAHDNEARMFAALALANCSASPENKAAIGKEALLQLVEYMKDEGKDNMAKSFCAMSVGNLAGEESNRDDIMKLGSIAALIQLMNENEDHCECGRYGALALGNIAVEPKNRKQVVDEGGIEVLVLRACNVDVNVRKNSLFALCQICITPDFRATVVRHGILDPLILMAQRDMSNAQILRDVAAIFSCLSSVGENQQEISNRALASIIPLLTSGDAEVERHACGAIANLSESIHSHKLFLTEEPAGLASLIALASSSPDPQCKGEASRAIANLAANREMQHVLLSKAVLPPMVAALTENDPNCQRFAALSLANIATAIPFQIEVIKEGAIPPLVSLVRGGSVPLEAKKYAALAIANLSATDANHPALMLEEGFLESMFAFANVPDDVSQYYVATAISNMCANHENRRYVVQEGGLQTLIALAYNPDSDIRQKAASALRELSLNREISIKIVQEQGLEPIVQMLDDEDDLQVLAEALGCLHNFSLSDENKFEIAKTDAIRTMIAFIQNEDLDVATQSCACLANLAQMADLQPLIADNDQFTDCINHVMRSRYIEVQRESGRLLARICTSQEEHIINDIFESGLHKFLITLLLSHDMPCQEIAAFGVGNLSCHASHRTELCLSGAVGPLCTLSQSDDVVSVETRRLCLLALGHLAKSPECCDAFMDKGAPSILVSMCDDDDDKVKRNAAYAITMLAHKSEMRDVITNEGGLELVLFLSRATDADTSHIVVPAIANLSFAAVNRHDICSYGGLPPVLHALKDEDTNQQMLGCCALANLAEETENLSFIVGSGAFERVILITEDDSCDSRVLREAYRALGNLSTCVEYGDRVTQNEKVVQHLVKHLQHKDQDMRRMAAMVISNISANVKNHSTLIRNEVFDPIGTILRNALLEEKGKSDFSIVHFVLLTISNIATCKEHHNAIKKEFLDILPPLTKHRDIRCRQHAVMLIGNLCSIPENLKDLVGAGFLPIISSFAFPSQSEDSANTRLQAIFGLAGFALHSDYRTEAMDKGSLQPLFRVTSDIKSSGETTESIETLRATSVALRNFTLSLDRNPLLLDEGIVSALISLSRIPDSACQLNAFDGLTTIAELDEASQTAMLEEGLFETFISCLNQRTLDTDIRRQILRCVAIFALTRSSQSALLRSSICTRLKVLVASSEDVLACRYAAMVIGTLAAKSKNHQFLFNSGMIQEICGVACVCNDTDTRRCITFALQNITESQSNETHCNTHLVHKVLITLLKDTDPTVRLHAAIAVRQLCSFESSKVEFMGAGGLPLIIRLSQSEDTELKRELAATLRNMSRTDKFKTVLMEKKVCLTALLELCRSSDAVVSLQSCHAIANLAEMSESPRIMVRSGVLHHLNYAWVHMHEKSSDIGREVARTLANLTVDTLLCPDIFSKGGGATLERALKSPDVLSQQFALMGLANLFKGDNVAEMISNDNLVKTLFITVSRNQPETDLHRHAFLSLTHFSSAQKNQSVLVAEGLVDLASGAIRRGGVNIVSGIVCVANLAKSEENHQSLFDICVVPDLVGLLSSSDTSTLQAVLAALKGLSTTIDLRRQIIAANSCGKLLSLAISEEAEPKVDAICVLCNLSFEGLLQNADPSFFDGIPIVTMCSFLGNKHASYRYFGAVAIGHLAMDTRFNDALLQDDTLSVATEAFRASDCDETRRCLSLALCNLSVIEVNRKRIVKVGGLELLVALVLSNEEESMQAGLSALRAIAADVCFHKALLKSGAIETARKGLGCNYVNCQKETAALTLALSQDKVIEKDITAHLTPGLLRLLTDADVACQQLILNTLVKWSENKDLHIILVEENRVPEVLRVFSSTNSQVELLIEISRCLGNFAANGEVFSMLVGSHTDDVLINLMAFNDATLTRLSAIGLMNLSQTDPDEESKIDNRAVEALRVAMEKRLGQGSGGYAALAISSLTTKHEKCDSSVMTKIFAALLALTKRSDKEERFHACFAINQMLLHYENCCDWEFAVATLSYVVDESHRLGDNETMMHAVSAIRKLLAQEGGSSSADHGLVMAKICDVAHNGSLTDQREIASYFFQVSLNSSELGEIISDSKKVLQSIMHLCNSPDEEVARMSLGAVANVAELEAYRDVLIEDTEHLNQTVSLLKTSSIEVKREASRMVANILTSENAHARYFTASAVGAIASLSKSLDDEMRYNVALCCRKISASKTQAAALDRQIVSRVLVLLSADSLVAVRRQISSAAFEFVSNTHDETVTFDTRLVKAVLSLAREKDDEILVPAACALQVLAKRTDLHKTLLIHGIADVMQQHFVNVSSIALLRESSRTLASVLENGSSQDRLAKEGIIPSIVSLASHQDGIVGENVALCLCLLTSTVVGVSSMLAKDEIEALVKFLSARSDACFEAAAVGLGNLLASAINKGHFESVGGFEATVNTLEDGRSGSCRKAIARIVYKIATKDSICKILLDGGALACLFKDIDRKMCDVVPILMALCNLQSKKFSPECQLEPNSLRLIVNISLVQKSAGTKEGLMALCNMSRSSNVQHELTKQGCISLLLDLLQEDSHVDVHEYAAMLFCNLSTSRENREEFLTADPIPVLIALISSSKKVGVWRASLVSLFNVSTAMSSHQKMIDSDIMSLLQVMCSHHDVLCKRYALLILINLAANHELRVAVYRGKTIQTLIVLLKDSDEDCKLFACACLSNLANHHVPQNLIGVHGGFKILMALASGGNRTRHQAVSCLMNSAAKETNRDIFLEIGVIDVLIQNSWDGEGEATNLELSCSIAIANLSREKSTPDFFRKTECFAVLLALAKSPNLYTKCAGLRAMQCLIPELKGSLDTFLKDICTVFVESTTVEDPEVLQDSMSCLSIFTQKVSIDKVQIATWCASSLSSVLSNSKNADCAQHGFGVLANLAEDIDTHAVFKKHFKMESVAPSLKTGTIGVKREIVRALCNFHSSPVFPTDDALSNLLSEILGDEESSFTDPEYQESVALLLMRLASDIHTHPIIFPACLPVILFLLKVFGFKTKMYAACALQDLSGNSENSKEIGENGGIESAVVLGRLSKPEAYSPGFAILESLSEILTLRKPIVAKGGVEAATACLKIAQKSAQRHILGLLANLSEDHEMQVPMVAKGVHTSITLLMHRVDCAGEPRLEEHAMRAIANLCCSAKNQMKVYSCGGLDFLMSRISSESPVSRVYLAMGFLLLVSNPQVRDSMKKTGVLNAHIQALATSDIFEYKQCAAEAVKRVSLDAGETVELSEDFGVEYTLRLCQNDDPKVKQNGCMTMANLAMKPELEDEILKLDSISILCREGRSDAPDEGVLREIARFFSFLAQGERCQAAMMEHGVNALLLSMAHCQDRKTRRFAGLSICNLCFTRHVATLLDRGAVHSVAALTNCADVPVQRYAALAIAGLSLGAGGDAQRQMLEQRIMMPLITMITIPDREMNRYSVLALSCATLGSSDNVTLSTILTDNVLEYGVVSPVIGLLRPPLSDVQDLELVHTCIFLLGTFSEHESLREKLVQHECVALVVSHINYICVDGDTVAMDIRRATGYFLACFAQHRQYHDCLEQAGAFEVAVFITNTPDQICQDCGSFILVHLARGHNSDHQIKLAQIGGAQACVTLMSTLPRGLARHYAVRALTEMAENVHNHKIISDCGGVQALLRESKKKAGPSDESLGSNNIRAEALGAIRKVATSRVIKYPRPY